MIRSYKNWIQLARMFEISPFREYQFPVAVINRLIKASPPNLTAPKLFELYSTTSSGLTQRDLTDFNLS